MNSLIIMYIIAVMLAAAICLLLIILRKFSQNSWEKSEKSINDTTRDSLKLVGDLISQNQKAIGDMQSERLSKIEDSMKDVRETTAGSLEAMRVDNQKKLDEIRGVVDEKLQKSIEEKMTNSFRLVNERLEQVYKGLGEMQTLANGVGDLKKVLSNVKTRGILGELQLGSILSEIMAPEQYAANVKPIPGSNNIVEYALKLPGKDGNCVYLPIDSKFPGDLYQQLLDAYDSGDSGAVDSAVKSLTKRIKDEANDIATKYIEPPYTTDFAIMFLPFEGLYAEVINRGMVEELQNKYKVNIAGPSTMAAMLNSLQMGFRTLAIEKRSGEVWHILGNVKSEFEKFSDVLSSAQKRINSANNDLDLLIGTRTRAIRKSLGNIEPVSDTSDDEISGNDADTDI